MLDASLSLFGFAFRVVKQVNGMNDDAALLRQYVDDGSEPAFAELVHRYVNLVYAAALRRTGGDPHQAADVAQQVFTSLARHARSLTTHPALGAWLHRATRNAALNLMKAEHRRRARETLVALDAAGSPDQLAEWDRVRPLLDATVDELSEPDRTAIVLRFLHQAGYAQIAAALRVTEDAARMRTERALDKLRRCLARRGVTSTSAALGLAMSHQAFGAAPAGLAGSLTTAALSAAPAVSASFVSVLLMSKLTAPLISGAVAATLTAVAWTSLTSGVTAEELRALQAENQRLTAATAPDASPEALAKAAEEYSAQAHALVRIVRQRQTERAAAAGASSNTASSGGAAPPATVSTDKAVYRDRGLATPRDAALSFAWASDAADPEALARMIWFDPDVRAKAIETMATLPPSLIREYPTPEAFYGFIIAALCLEAPPPAADIVYGMIGTVQPTEVRPGRLVYPNRHEYQQTPEGWKFVFPEVGVTRWLHVLGDSVLTRGESK